MPPPSEDFFVYVLHSQMEQENVVLDLSTDGSSTATLKRREPSKPDNQQWRVYRSGHIQNVAMAGKAVGSGFLTRVSPDKAPGEVILANVINDPNDFRQVWHFEGGPNRVKNAPPWRIQSTVIGIPQDGVPSLQFLLTATFEDVPVEVSQPAGDPPPEGQRWYGLPRRGEWDDD